MIYALHHIGRLPTVKNQPAYTGNVNAYIQAVVRIATEEGTTTVPPDTQAYLRVRPEHEGAWYVWGLVDDLTVENVTHVFESCVYSDSDRMEISIVWMTNAELDALPEFDGW